MGCRTKSFHIKAHKSFLMTITLHKFGRSHHTHTSKPAAHSRPQAYPEIRSEHLIVVIFMIFCLSSLCPRPS